MEGGIVEIVVVGVIGVNGDTGVRGVPEPVPVPERTLLRVAEADSGVGGSGGLLSSSALAPVPEATTEI